MKRVVFLVEILFAFTASLSVANPGDTLWTRTYGGNHADIASSVQQTTDGGYIIAGSTYSFGAGMFDFYLVKTDNNGDTLWTRTFGGTSSDYAYSVQQTADGGYIIAGVTVSSDTDRIDIYVLKTDNDGDTSWTRTYGGNERDNGYSVQQTADSGYIIAGHTRSFGAGGYDFYLLKINKNGDTLWTRTYGGSGADHAFSVQQTIDGGYIIAGTTSSFGAGSWDVYLVKTDNIGDTIWTRTYGGSGQDHAYSIQHTSDGGYIVTGTTSSYGDGRGAIYLLRIDANGDTLWTRTYGGSEIDESYSVRQTSDGGYIIAGVTSSYGAGSWDNYLVRTDNNGDTLWTRTYGSSKSDKGYLVSVQQTTDGGFIIAGSTYSFGPSGLDFYLVKTIPELTGR
jgi:hypothetical protein